MTDTFYGAAPTPQLEAPRGHAGRMSDELLLRLIEQTMSALAGADGAIPCMEMAPSYNAMLAVAAANHPDHVFLAALRPLEHANFIGVASMRALFGQLRLVLESIAPASR